MILLSRIAGVIAAVVIVETTYGQHLSSPRGIGIGGFTGLSSGSASLDWNPAGLMFVRDWEVSLANYIPFSAGTTGFTLHSTGLTKRFLVDHAASLRYSPGKKTEFVVPTAFRFADSNVVLQTSFDQEIVYQEPYALGYAHRFTHDLVVGAAARFVSEKITDAEYYLDTNSVIRSRSVDYDGAMWLFDVGAVWTPASEWQFGLALKNLVRLNERLLPDELEQYRLDIPIVVRGGAAYSGFRDFAMSLDGDMKQRLRFGFEWSLFTAAESDALTRVSVRAGSYLDPDALPAVEALAAGLGILYGPVQIDVSYLKFLSQGDRGGSAGSFSPVADVEYNRFTNDRLSLSVQFSLGRTSEPPARIDAVDIGGPVYPSSAMTYSHSPLGTVRITNTSNQSVTARVGFSMERLMDAPTESRPVPMEPGEQVDVPFFAIFNEAIKSVPATAIREGQVSVSTERGESVDDRFQTHVLVYSRNSWNGEASQLRYFIAPDDPDVLRFTRGVMGEYKATLDTTDIRIRDFVRARLLFNEFSSRLAYVHDPRKSQDFVQYPSETLSLRGGDCDDMAVCYSALLSSIGMATAFVDVIPPSDPSSAHIYLMFDTGIGAESVGLVSDNPKRYLLRSNRKGKETVWIPIETTAMTKGFDEAWDEGARQFYEDSELGMGLVKGWVRIVDVQDVF